MEQAVTIKGTKSGIILVLDGNAPFDELLPEVSDKFKQASSFLGSNSMGLIVRGRRLLDNESDLLKKVIEESSSLSITCVLNDDESLNEALLSKFEKAGASPLNKKETGESRKAVFEHESLFLPGDEAIIHKGNLRSGQDISSSKSVIVLGDVKPGANVTSEGSIFVLGELRGNAFAGACGDISAFIMALTLDPIQVRIADTIAISPDAEKGSKLKVRKKSVLKNSQGGPEVAYIENGHIVKTGYGPGFIRQIYKG